MLQRVALGLHNGFPVRKKSYQSYAEECVNEWLTQRGLIFKRELKVGMWFIDFAFIDRMIALEIDGKQHDLPDRKTKDAQKDAFLHQRGWVVIRLRWKANFKQEIDRFCDTFTE
jgi:very-short-patch-repair endonuclease